MMCGRAAMKTKVSVSDDDGRAKKQADVSARSLSLGGRGGDDKIMPPGEKNRRTLLTTQDSNKQQ